MNTAGTAFFALAALVQYNDPDPVRWMCLYGSAAIACAAVPRKVRFPIALAVAVVATAWLLMIEVPVAASLQIFQAWQMSSGGSEEAREAGGLLIVAVSMAALALRSMPREDVDAAMHVRPRSSWSA